MDLFELSDNLIDKENSNFRMRYCFWYLPQNFSGRLERNTMISIFRTIDAYYKNGGERDDIGYQHNQAIGEMIKNARVHGGSKENPTFFGLFMDEFKFILGCNDGGDYFRNKEIKRIWERKKDLKEFHKSDNPNVGAHFGYSYFRIRFDEIKVDTKHGTLYGIVNLENYFKRKITLGL